MSHSEVQNQQGRKLFSSHGAREKVNICRKTNLLMLKGYQISKKSACTISEQQDLMEHLNLSLARWEEVVWKLYKYTTEKNNFRRTHNAGRTDWFPTMLCIIKDLSKAILKCF